MSEPLLTESVRLTLGIALASGVAGTWLGVIYTLFSIWRQK